MIILTRKTAKESSVIKFQLCLFVCIVHWYVLLPKGKCIELFYIPIKPQNIFPTLNFIFEIL